MGVIRQFQCPSCKETWEICVGHGMKHGVLGRVMGEFPENTRQKIAEDVQGGDLPLFHFQYQAVSCGHCRDVVAIPVLRLLDSGRLYVGKCPECGGEAEPAAEDSPIACPKCGILLDVRDTGHWD
ncbi:MAG: hypothetical protein HFG14_07465 [Lachnospiraceae bacterium]|jgi:DNA-directed RNA polymerase subunit RPC12/RpoP|nr:hypothetical protein [Lachnospiraceae bacterium]NBJ81898.1 hypothetical protein [bacterium 1XD42-76]NBK04398.1 hypothetical protein [bacterium 1XD42-94]